MASLEEVKVLVKTLAPPTAALKPGDWVETTGGRIGRVMIHGWDAEGSFGYLVEIDRSNDLIWVYHLGVHKGTHKARRAPADS